MDLEKTGHSKHLLRVHLSFPTVSNVILDREHISYLRSVATETLIESNMRLIDFGNGGDSIFMIVQYPPKVSISTMVNVLRAKMSRMIRRDMSDIRKITEKKKTLWKREYTAKSLS